MQRVSPMQDHYSMFKPAGMITVPVTTKQVFVPIRPAAPCPKDCDMPKFIPADKSGHLFLNLEYHYLCPKRAYSIEASYKGLK